jgi:hypothetical protein
MGVIKDRSVPVLGLKLALVEDEEALAKIERNALPRDRNQVRYYGNDVVTELVAFAYPRFQTQTRGAISSEHPGTKSSLLRRIYLILRS